MRSVLLLVVASHVLLPRDGVKKIVRAGVVSWMCSPLVISWADLTDRLTVEGGNVLEDMDALT